MLHDERFRGLSCPSLKKSTLEKGGIIFEFGSSTPVRGGAWPDLLYL
jgi:hypothetical protein